MQNQIISQTDDFKIYLQGSSSKGALLNGTFETSETRGHFWVYSNHPKSGEKRIPIPPHDNLKLIDLGLQFICLLTHSKKVYMFGDFAYNAMNAPNADPVNGTLLKVKIITKKREVDDGEDEFILNEQFALEPIAMSCGEQFVTVLDSGNRVWFCGAASFGIGGMLYNIVKLQCLLLQ